MSTSLATLSFVKAKEDGSILSMWEPQRTEDYEKDCAAGRMYGLELVNYMQQRASFGVLNQVVKAISRHKMGAIEIGFFTAIGALAVAGMAAMPEPPKG